MPLDSRDKRASAIGVGSPSRLLLPVPDPEAEDQGDRQQVDFAYRGILAVNLTFDSVKGGIVPMRITGGRSSARNYGGETLRIFGGQS